MPIPDRYRNTINDLMALTHQGKLAWNRGAGRTYSASLDRYSVLVREVQFDAETDYTVRIINDEGLEVDEFSVSARDSDGPKMQYLWSEARRVAQGVDEAIEWIETELQRLRSH